jgi:multidrug resistance efflux pump
MQTSVDSLGLPALRAVAPPKALHKLAVALAAIFLTLPVALLVVPWQQNVQASGRVTALDPLDRVQVIPAPVTGRLVDLRVQEGVRVEKGQVLAEMADQDPDYARRLEQQFQFTNDKVEAAKGMVDFYGQQLVFLEDAREQAVSSATYELNVAIEKVRATERELEGLEAALDQKRADRERKSTLFTRGVVSELDFQKAEADYLAARAEVEAAKSKVEQARNEEKAKMADINKIASDQQAKIESTKSAREDARSKVALAEKELTEATTKLERQKTQVIVAPRTGYVLRIHAASSADLLSQGDPLIELIPETDALAVELWVRGIDAPLVTPGRKVRLQFEGWPAVQFAGWPSVAVGTFGGVVSVVDAQGNAEGRFRVLVLPDPQDQPWPDQVYLRQGVRTNGWLLLDTVSLGYEMWRQLNAFPPSVRSAPEKTPPSDPPKAKKNGSQSK